MNQPKNFSLSSFKFIYSKLKLLFLIGVFTVFVCSILIIPVACNHPVTVVGKFSWKYFGVNYLLTSATVKLQSEDGEETKTATTDANGRATFMFNNNPGKMTVMVNLKNNYFLFQSSCGVNEVKRIQTSAGPYSSIPKEVDVNFGSFKEAPIWKTITVTADKLVNGGITPGRVTICTSHGPIRYSPKTKIIYIPGSKADSPDAVNHEYGHAIMDQYIPVPLISTCSESHKLGVATSEQCAFVEGWADFFSIFGKANRNAALVTIFNIAEMEKYFSTLTYSSALKDEGRVAAGLWDLYDTHNDSNISGNPDFGSLYYTDNNSAYPVSLKNFIQALKYTNTLTFVIYRNELYGELNSQQLNYAKDIMHYNYLSGN